MNPSSHPRTDLPFLRRRIKSGTAQAPAAAPAREIAPVREAPPAPEVATAPRSGSLILGRANPPVPAQAPTAGLGLTLGRSTPPSSAPQTPALPPTQQQTQPQAPALQRTSAGLNLGAPAAQPLSPRAKRLVAQREQAKVEDHEVNLLFQAPGIRDVYELNLVDRVLRLPALQSAVGTLVVSGSTAIAWESVRRVAGAQTVDGHKAGSPVMTRGNRELVGYHGREALVSLRHVRELRRAIFINRSDAAMGVRLLSGDSVALPPAADGTQIVLLVHRIGNVLELRAEPVPYDWPDVQIWREFDFNMTHAAPTTAYGR